MKILISPVIFVEIRAIRQLRLIIFTLKAIKVEMKVVIALQEKDAFNSAFVVPLNEQQARMFLMAFEDRQFRKKCSIFDYKFFDNERSICTGIKE